ncbi:MAG: hypothetical protein ACRD8O_20605 [Bryobacteraceae bacterium]
MVSRTCVSCGGRLRRIRRTFKQKFLFSAVYECVKCADRKLEDQWYFFLLGKVSRCPRCGTHRVQKLRGLDKIDRMYRNPLSFFQKYFGAPIHWCPFCRLQFYDLRKRADAKDRSLVVNTAKPPE